MKVLLYGANGYTGHLVARIARDLPGAPDLILAGRNAAKVEAVADALGYEARVFGLDVPSTVDACLEGVSVVLHCAGPFSRTSQPMADACIRQKVHYLDVTGELAVFEALAARDGEARAAGVMLMPGVGFDVVPSDCLAVHVARRLPGATKLVVALRGLGGSMSHGTATTTVENLHKGGFVRKNGALKPVSIGTPTRKVDFGRGPTLVMGVPLGDLSTAFRSTGIGDIETYYAAPRGMVIGVRAMGLVPWLMGSKPVQRLIQSRVDKAPAGPTDEQRAKAKSIVYAEVTNDSGARVASRLETPEGYTTTAYTALAIAKRAAAGDVKAGFQSPAMAYGPDLVLEVPGVIRTDVS